MATDPLEIPIPLDTPHQSFRTTLDGVDFIVRLDYQERWDRWLLDLLTLDETVIIAGVRLMSQWLPLAGLVSPLRPAGSLYVYNTAGDDPPGFSDLGRHVKLIYFPAG